jgi:hypothetical protein
MPNHPHVICWTLGMMLQALQLRGLEQAFCWDLICWLRVVQRLTGAAGPPVNDGRLLGYRFELSTQVAIFVGYLGRPDAKSPQCHSLDT